MDKVLHFLVGVAIGLCFYRSLRYALTITTIAAAGKELYDHVSGKGVVEVLDFAWTLIGAFVVFGFILVYELTFSNHTELLKSKDGNKFDN